MLYYPVSAMINALVSTAAGMIVLARRPESSLNRSFSYFALSVAAWSYCYFIWQISGAPEQAFFWSKYVMAGSSFIPAAFIHFTFNLTGKYRKNRAVIIIAYLFSLIFAALSVLTDHIVADVRPRMGFAFWPSAGPFYGFFILMFFSLSAAAHFILFRAFKNETGYKRNQIKYVFWGTLIAFTGGSTNYFLWFDINIPPFGNLLVSAYVVLVAYAVIKYRLMDFQIVVTRTGIILAIYALVLGLPFWLGYEKGMWREATWVMLILATAGPFMYLHVQRKAEDQLLMEQRRYQSTLRRASLGMGRVKDLKRLLNLLVHIVTRTVRVEHASVYLLHHDSGQFILKAAKGRGVSPGDSIFGPDSALIRGLRESKEPLLYEDVRMGAKSGFLSGVMDIMERLEAELVLPCVIDSRMLAVILMGKKRSGKTYSHDDLVVFSILASQAGLAIENAMFYETAQKTTEQLFKAEKMATIGTMADGLSHQINNRLHAMGFVAGDAQDSIRLLKGKEGLSAEVRDMVDEVEYALVRIQDNVKRGGEIVGGLLRYTRAGAEGMGPVDLDELLESSLEMARFKIKFNQFRFVRGFDPATPKVRGNFTQLQEVFFNMIDNAYDAMMQRKTDLSESGYSPSLEVGARADGDLVSVSFRDNGIGVRPEDFGKMFTPFFTTKITARKGTGLGMYVIRQIIEENHGGSVRFESQYKKGSTVTVTLPRA
jgi:signal transduction histidine kinase